MLTPDRLPPSPRRTRRPAITADQLAAAADPLNRISMGSLAPAVELTLPEYWLLSSVVATGSQSIGTLADYLGIPPTAMSLISQRLVTLGLAIQLTGVDGEQRLVASTAGRALVTDINQRRRHAITTALRHLAPSERQTIADALRTFADLATPARSHRDDPRSARRPRNARTPR